MKIERINKGSWGKIRAFFDIRTEEGFVVKGFKIIALIYCQNIIRFRVKTIISDNKFKSENSINIDI